MVTQALQPLFETYDELTGTVERSDHHFFQGNLTRWFEFLDQSAPFARPILQQLEASVHFESWYAPYQAMMHGAGAKAVEWPTELRKRLGIQMLLFRQFAGGSIDPRLFAFMVLLTGKHTPDGVTRIIEQMFRPMAGELRRFLAETAEPAPTWDEMKRMLANPPDLTQLAGVAEPSAAVPKEAKAEMFTLKPSIWGMGVDLKEVWRRIEPKLRRKPR